jgi:hypothetical protein
MENELAQEQQANRFAGVNNTHRHRLEKPAGKKQTVNIGSGAETKARQDIYSWRASHQFGFP